MFDNDDEIPEWEMRDEQPPEHLEKKWNKREGEGGKSIVCRSCGKRVSADLLLCLYCGNPTGIKPGVFGHLRSWIFHSPVGAVIFFIIIAIIAFFLIF